MRCFYHSDLDGEASAAIVRLKFGDVECIPVNYGRHFPVESVFPDERIWIIDYSLQEEGAWWALMYRTDDVVWIDHHDDAIKRSEAEGTSHLAGLRRSSGGAGCELTWEYLFPECDIPDGIAYIGDFDTWTFKHGALTREFQQGLMMAYDTRPVEGWSSTWERIFQSSVGFVSEVRDIGRKGLAKRTISDAQDILAYGFEAEFQGYRCAVINRNRTGSDYFASLEDLGFDIYMPVVFDGTRWSVSVYEGPGIRGKGVHLGELCRVKFKGGGHPGAAGFQCDELPIMVMGRLG